MQFKVKDFLTQYLLTKYCLGYQRLDMMNRITKDHRDVFNDQESRILLALYDETVAGLDQLPEVERTILTRQYIEGEYQPIVRDELGLKSSAYYRRQIKARRHLADALNKAPTFQRLEISFTP
ncbi:hypothetical protein [Limosilactobacillus fermentum]|uniref:hypothetical protein n=1 Tax=Limosilactobacillus fermentum TaxID=1613 RepID=UPI001965B86F|nr:hypothetical protein [Limosilactobacillus fermentum]MBM9561331.1 hypothetical protein [Limosilactobacillus fermentum]